MASRLMFRLFLREDELQFASKKAYKVSETRYSPSGQGHETSSINPSQLLANPHPLNNDRPNREEFRLKSYGLEGMRYMRVS